MQKFPRHWETLDLGRARSTSYLSDLGSPLLAFDGHRRLWLQGCTSDPGVSHRPKSGLMRRRCEFLLRHASEEVNASSYISARQPLVGRLRQLAQLVVLSYEAQ